MTLILENLKTTKKKSKSNPDSFLAGIPAFTIPKANDKKVEGLVFNNEAIEYTNLFKRKGEKIGDRLLFVSNYMVNGVESFVMDVTAEKEIVLDKKYACNKVNQNTKTLSSRAVYKALIEWFKLDVSIPHTFVLEKYKTQSEEFFKVHLYENLVLNEGQDLPVVLEEAQVEPQEEVTNQPNTNN